MPGVERAGKSGREARQASAERDNRCAVVQGVGQDETDDCSANDVYRQRPPEPLHRKEGSGEEFRAVSNQTAQGAD